MAGDPGGTVKRLVWKRTRTFMAVMLGVVALLAVMWLMIYVPRWIDAYEDWRNPGRIKGMIAPF